MSDRAPPSAGRPGLPPLERPKKSKRGFAALSPERRREIARKGGAAVPAHLRSFSQDRELARVSGVKGGKALHATGKAHKWASRADHDRATRRSRAEEDDQ